MNLLDGQDLRQGAGRADRQPRLSVRLKEITSCKLHSKFVYQSGSLEYVKSLI
jgi:hypothetical protein